MSEQELQLALDEVMGCLQAARNKKVERDYIGVAGIVACVLTTMVGVFMVSGGLDAGWLVLGAAIAIAVVSILIITSRPPA